MKRKYLLLTIIIISSITIVGCSNNISNNEDKLLDTIVVDENTKKTTSENTELKIEMTSKTEGININGSSSNYGLSCNGKLVYYTYLLDDKDGTMVQFPEPVLDTLKIGTISEDRDEVTGLNKINWEDKSENGRVLMNFNENNQGRILKDNKVYKFNSSGEMQEITAYEPLVKEHKDDLRIFESYLNGRLDLYTIGGKDGKSVNIIDTKEDNYYEINSKGLASIGNRTFKPLAIEDNKIYVSITGASDNYDLTVNHDSIIGYFENSEFTTIISPDNGVKIDIKGGSIYSNNKILFSGYVENKNGIWNYDIESKKLVCEIEVEDGIFFELNINEEKDKIALISHDYSGNSNEYTLSIGLINENLEISNLTSILSTESKSEIKSFAGWDEDGNSFYLNSILPSEGDTISNEINASYEIYTILN